MVNCVTDQTAPSEVVWSGTTLFVNEASAKLALHSSKLPLCQVYLCNTIYHGKLSETLTMV